MKRAATRHPFAHLWRRLAGAETLCSTNATGRSVVAQGTPWDDIEDRPEVRAYLGSFDAYIAAGGSDAPPFVRALKSAALTDLKKARS